MKMRKIPRDIAIAVPDASITFEQYRKAVGKVVKILGEDDGRAFVIVKIA